MSWLNKDDVGRSHAVADVLKYVRLPLLAPQYLTDKVAKESLIHNSLPCRLTASFVLNISLQKKQTKQLNRTIKILPHHQ